MVELTGKNGDEHAFRATAGANLLSARGVVEVPLGRGAWLVSARRSYTDVLRSALYERLFGFRRRASQGNDAGKLRRAQAVRSCIHDARLHALSLPKLKEQRSGGLLDVLRPLPRNIGRLHVAPAGREQTFKAGRR